MGGYLRVKFSDQFGGYARYYRVFINDSDSMRDSFGDQKTAYGAGLEYYTEDNKTIGFYLDLTTGKNKIFIFPVVGFGAKFPISK